MRKYHKRDLGARYIGERRCEFSMWAPLLEELTVRIVSPRSRDIPMSRDEDGYFHATVEDIGPGDRYFYRLNKGDQRPDPVSFFQPEGVLGPSAVIDHAAFKWRDRDHRSRPVEDMIIYELHTGTFTERGTFEAVIEKLPYLLELGVNAVEIMPVGQFSGERNWGYDGVYLFAAQNSYGGPEGLKKLVDECHARDISVILDVVYNHLGPEGNFIHEYMPFFTEKYRTPWGKAVNYDDAYSAGVRDLVVQNALYWFDNYHIDALRLDAVHGIYDTGAKHILKELSERTGGFSAARGRDFFLIAESDLNDTRVIEPYSRGGYGVDAQWNDDFHHSLHTLLTGETRGYYADFGEVAQMARAVKEGFVYSWDYSAFRKRFHGSSSAGIPQSRFVVCSQNHDQVGNRMKGERLSTLVDIERSKSAAGLVILSSAIPLLFMGEEYGEESPFLYFIDFHDGDLVNAVREGRKKEFGSFEWEGEPDDPADTETFLKTRLRWDKLAEKRHRTLFDLYRKLISIRKEAAALFRDEKASVETFFDEQDKYLCITRRGTRGGIFIVVNFNPDKRVHIPVALEGDWDKAIETSAEEWLGPGEILPGRISGKTEISVRPSGLGVYRLRS
ncbi:MAG: malto-oligosyltrehalose trehalohydrolase [Candidatus Omnitrophica bacterium]|nr:malto-oligosyltrehalose trehalohydrolase [Candidatus Omnitrophota bacterium]